MDKTSLSRIRSLLTPHERRRAIALLCLMVIGMMLETLGVGFVVPAVAILTQSDVAVAYPSVAPFLDLLGNPTQARLVTMGMLALVGIYLVKAVFLGVLAWRQSKFAFDVRARLSQKLFDVYVHQPYTFHLQRNSAQLIRNTIYEVDIFTNHITSPLFVLLSEGLVLAGIVALLLWLEPAGALMVALVLGSASWAFHRSTRSRVSRWGVARQFHEGLRLQHLQQGLAGAKEAKLLGREAGLLAQYHPHNMESAAVGHAQATFQLLPRLWLELLAVTGLALLIGVMVASGRPVNSVVPILGLFGAAAFRLVPSANRILGAMQQLRYGFPVIETLYGEIRLTPPPRVVRGASHPLVFQKDIRLAGVDYAYPESSRNSLTGVSIAIAKGESVGFVGPSGAGKSTLVDVVLGLLVPGSGCVQVDGVDIQSDLRAWQNQIGYVPQTIYLTDDTLRRNVAFGLPDAEIDETSVARAIRLAQLTELVDTLPEGLETVVGERGVRLSGGQRQRIGIARALYHDPAVIVLDEATSALDVDIEREVMAAVTALRGDKTILIVAHRLSTVANCDRLYVLRAGTIVEESVPVGL